MVMYYIVRLKKGRNIYYFSGDPNNPYSTDITSDMTQATHFESLDYNVAVFVAQYMRDHGYEAEVI